jgi:hypothetical protein
MNNLNIISKNEARNINGGGSYCKVCGYGNNVYKSWANVASHILRNHLGVFVGTYAYNIWKYRKVLAWSIGL